MMHDRYPFLGACNADLWDHNYTGADGHNVGVWEWDENIGNFGLTVSHYEVYLDGPLTGTPVETSFSDSLTAHRASDPKSDSEGDVGWTNVAVGAVNGSLFAPALMAHC